MEPTFLVVHRQETDEGQADHDERKSRDLGLRRLRDDAGNCGRCCAERDKDHGEPGDEREARQHHAPPRPTLGESRHLDRRHSREVSRNERQHTGRDHGRKAGKERDRNFLAHQRS